MSLQRSGYKDNDFPVVLTLSLTLLTCSLWWKPDAMWTAQWRSPRSKELKAVSSQQPARTQGPKSNSPWGTNSCQQPRESASKQILPQLSLEVTAALADILIAASWKNLSQRTHLNCVCISDLHKLWDKCSYFKVSVHYHSPHPNTHT